MKEKVVSQSVVFHRDRFDRQADARQEASIVAATFVRTAREKANLTQQELADALGVSVSRISDIENSRRRPRAKFAFDSISLGFLYEVQDVTGRKLVVEEGGAMTNEHYGLDKARLTV